EDLDPERREHRVARAGYERHAANHAALGLDVQETAAPRDAIDFLDAAQRRLVTRHEAFGVSADGVQRRLTEWLGRSAGITLEARDAQHDRSSPERPGQDCVVAGQLPELPNQGGGPARDELLHPGPKDPARPRPH